MKKFTPLLSLVFLFCLVALGVPRSSQAVPTVYDTKTLPGSSCRIVGCNWSPVVVSDITLLYSGFVSYTPFNFYKNDPYADQCTISCPILKDNSTDSVGVRGAWIDVLVQPIGNQPTSGNATRAATCRLSETTAPWTDTGGRVTESQGDGAQASTPFASTNTNNTQNRLNLSIPYPNVPQDAWSHGSTYAGGNAVITCTIPVATTIYGYGWQEIGANSSDW